MESLVQEEDDDAISSYPMLAKTPWSWPLHSLLLFVCSQPIAGICSIWRRSLGTRQARLTKECEYSLKLLRVQLPVTLENVSVDAVRRYFRRTDRYVSAYAGRNGVTLTPTEAAYVTRKYSSHRRIPAEEIARIVAERGG